MADLLTSSLVKGVLIFEEQLQIMLSDLCKEELHKLHLHYLSRV